MSRLVKGRCTGPESCRVGKFNRPGMVGGERCACACHTGAERCNEGAAVPIKADSAQLKRLAEIFEEFYEAIRLDAERRKWPQQ